MRCDEAQLVLSEAFDGEGTGPQLAADAANHRAGCEQCQRFEAELAQLRRELRFEVIDEVPDIAPRVVAALPRAKPRSRTPARARRLVPVAAAFVVGAVCSAIVFAGTRDGDRGVAAADIPARVVAAQQSVRSLSATVSIVERGWHADVPSRTFHGRLTYEAPESMTLILSDDTDYPSPAWITDDVALVVDGPTLWRKGPRACPAESQPACTPPAPEVSVVQRREPFADGSPVPLELITPVESFALAGTPATLPGRTIGGRDALGVVVTAGQVDALLDGLRPAGNLREVHPLDTVELWLDTRSFVPLALRVISADRPERARWAAARRYQERAGDVVLELELTDVRINGSDAEFKPPAPPAVASRTVDTGFVDGPSGAPQPESVPPGLAPHREGHIATTGPQVDVRTWTDGRAWLKVRSTSAWAGGRLFGDLGPIVRAVDLGAAGTAYASEDGSRVALHGDGIDVVVTGSVPSSRLRAVAADLGVVALPVPADWAESATATLADAQVAIDDLLVPASLTGFGPPAIRVEGDEVSMAYAGPGDRGFLLVQLPGAVFTPPLDPDVQGVRVRRREGRYSPSRGELEWGELGRVVSIRSTTLSLPELLAVAATLERS